MSDWINTMNQRLDEPTRAFVVKTLLGLLTAIFHHRQDGLKQVSAFERVCKVKPNILSEIQLHPSGASVVSCCLHHTAFRSPPPHPTHNAWSYVIATDRCESDFRSPVWQVPAGLLC